MATVRGSRVRKGDIPSVSSLALLHELLLLRFIHALELEVPAVRRRAVLAALQGDEGYGADDGDEVEGEVHEVADYRCGGESVGWVGLTMSTRHVELAPISTDVNLLLERLGHELA